MLGPSPTQTRVGFCLCESLPTQSPLTSSTGLDSPISLKRIMLGPSPTQTRVGFCLCESLPTHKTLYPWDTPQQ
ncbi:hypothetical protein Lalb_Chr18g0055931 [Lupinus albus]|uniref:Uncharacterized protein n=1 Tax=Lupinus albus TaxID=3870 RepID=A0A6A4P654_LUPAL|nr:hypothetical protein Lalb_Chr18g0055931 [Lupinus albus]